ncbi:hypothetical protein JCM4814A_74460 [Streptomyces phaeofaciens JCM 4814]|uniref:Uncharacterized protein n=1 Tax=Streptomyces phaeofaciens TaxID=68254 RepID=A0A918LXE1_9ACTN|nr:hypothetical protein [Streptomyces phaeofaciens]GGT63847.1 hypothetical protein GCM10010226_46920 [Streptomyces phaeofaciens]
MLERFPDEDGACRRLYALPTAEGPPSVPLTPEEAGRLLGRPARHEGGCPPP